MKEESLGRLTDAAWVWFLILLMAVQPWGWAVGIPLGIFTVLGVLRFLHRERMREERFWRMKNAQTSLELMSRQRHDWLNHVQVIMGYLGMKRQERILPYLRELTDRAREEREAARVGYPPLALALSTLNQRIPEWRWFVETGEEMKEIDPEWGDRLCEALDRTTAWLRKQGRGMEEPEEVWLRVEKTDSDWQITIHPDFPPELKVEPSEWTNLRDTIRERGGALEREEAAGGFTLRFAA
ncbi:Spo0B domain-containing protein [Salinithrix halophila]|uniref:Spo0B domain-containing protein n=1 Tax=Salinithrix halophila TaxID=1485204 RepID=A0ABV8JMD0_9BACL